MSQLKFSLLGSDSSPGIILISITGRVLPKPSTILPSVISFVFGTTSISSLKVIEKAPSAEIGPNLAVGFGGST